MDPPEAGQAAVSFVATVPLLLAALVVMIQVSVIGYSAWSAATAARAGARAALVGSEVGPAVRAALPAALSERARVELGPGGRTVRVEVTPPRLVPLAPRVPVSASASMQIGGQADAAN